MSISDNDANITIMPADVDDSDLNNNNTKGMTIS